MPHKPLALTRTPSRAAECRPEDIHCEDTPELVYCQARLLPGESTHITRTLNSLEIIENVSPKEV